MNRKIKKNCISLKHFTMNFHLLSNLSWLDWLLPVAKAFFFLLSPRLESLMQPLAFTFLYFHVWKIGLSFLCFGPWLPEGRGHGCDGQQSSWEKYKELFLAWIWHGPKVRLLSWQEILGAVLGGRGNYIFRHFWGALWPPNLGKDLPHPGPWVSPDRDHRWNFCVHPTAILTRLTVRSGWHLDPEGIDQLCSISWPSGVSIWLLNLSWSCGLDKKKGLLGRMPIGRLSLRKQHTLLFMVFSFSPIKLDFAFSHYLGERDKDLRLICKSCSSRPTYYYPCKKISFNVLKSFSYLLSLRGLHLPIFCYKFYIA